MEYPGFICSVSLTNFSPAWLFLWVIDFLSGSDQPKCCCG